MTKLHWIKWNGSDLLQDIKTERNSAWITKYPDLGYKVELWDRSIDPQGEWVELAMAPDLDAAKMIAQLNVEGEVV